MFVFDEIDFDYDVKMLQSLHSVNISESTRLKKLCLNRISF